jgi:uncharacterized membrane protein
MRAPARKEPGKEQGFVLIVTCVALAVLLGLAGLVIDVGRMYVVKSELQAFADAASLSAALQLDGTKTGFNRARDAAAKIADGDRAMKWDMGTRAISGFKLSFAKGDAAPDAKSWQEAPEDASGYHFARVTVEAAVPLTLMRAVEGIQSDASKVAAAGTAGNFRGKANAARLIE